MSYLDAKLRNEACLTPVDSLHVSYYFQIFGPTLILLGVITQAQTWEGVESGGEERRRANGRSCFPFASFHPFLYWTSLLEEISFLYRIPLLQQPRASKVFFFFFFP